MTLQPTRTYGVTSSGLLDTLGKMISALLVVFYRIWHGRLKLQGAGWLIRHAAVYLPGLQAFPLQLKDGTRIEVDFRDVSAWCWINQAVGDVFFEIGLLKAMQARMTSASVVWDVGANAGVLSYELARSHPHPRELHLFEPNPRIFTMARSALVKFPFAHAHQMGLSDTSSLLQMTVPPGRSTMGTVVPVRTGQHGNMIEVQCVKGDILVQEKQFTPPDIIKIDTEGHEIEVIAGLAEVIATFRPCIFFEHISLDDAEISGLIPPNYELYSVSDLDGMLSSGINRKTSHNSVLVPLQAASASAHL
jgi:FkbM family methyltransferase